MASYNLPLVVELLKSINSLNRTLNAKARHIMSPVSWAKEFCTIKVDAGRQTGKSWYCDMSCGCDDTGIIIVPSQGMGKHYRNSQFVFTPSSYSRVDKKFVKYVYIDEPSFISCGLNGIYEFFTNDGIERTFILIGA